MTETQDVILKEINQDLVLCQRLDVQIVLIKNTNYVCCGILAQQLNKVKIQGNNIRTFFVQKSIQATAEELDQQITRDVKFHVSDLQVTFKENHKCYFEVTNKHEFQQYNGYYIHEDLFLLFVQWLDKKQFLKYSRLFNDYLKILSQQVVEEKKRLHEEELKKLSQKHELHIKQLSSEFIYSLVNESLPGVVKHGFTTSDQCVQRLHDINHNPNYMFIEGKELKTPWIKKYHETVIHGHLSEKILFDMKKDKRLYPNRELFSFIDEKELIIDLQIAKQHDELCDYPLPKSRASSPVQRAASVILTPVLQTQSTPEEIKLYFKAQFKNNDIIIVKGQSQQDAVKQHIIQKQDVRRINIFNRHFPNDTIPLPKEQNEEIKLYLEKAMSARKLKCKEGQSRQEALKEHFLHKIEAGEIKGLAISLKAYNEHFPDDEIVMNLREIKKRNDDKKIVIDDGYTDAQRIYLLNAQKHHSIPSPVKETLKKELTSFTYPGTPDQILRIKNYNRMFPDDSIEELHDDVQKYKEKQAKKYDIEPTQAAIRAHILATESKVGLQLRINAYNERFPDDQLEIQE